MRLVLGKSYWCISAGVKVWVEYKLDKTAYVCKDVTGFKYFVDIADLEEVELDLLTTCGTFDTQDCISVEDLWKIVEQEKEKK